MLLNKAFPYIHSYTLIFCIYYLFIIYHNSLLIYIVLIVNLFSIIIGSLSYCFHSTLQYTDCLFVQNAFN